MSRIEIGIAVTAAVILFLFGIEHFSREVQAISGERFRRFLAKGTRHPILGFILGGLVTAVIQSSTATSVIAVGLVNAGVLSFKSSLGIIFGANVGTTVTAQLVALKLTDFAPALILIGFVTGLIPFRYRILGKSIFYFGLVFFSLNMVSNAVAPLRTDPTFQGALAGVQSPIAGVIAGAIFTALVQSSSVSTGVMIVLLQQGSISFSTALPIVLGANVGTTLTSLIASLNMDTSARRTAVSHSLYNIGGVLLFLPLIVPFEHALRLLELPDASALAAAHLLFNLVTSIIFLAAIVPFAKVVEKIVPDDGGGEEAIEQPPSELTQGEPQGDDLRQWLAGVLQRITSAYTGAVLALQTHDKKIENRARRNSSIARFALREGFELVNRFARGSLANNDSTVVLRVVITLDHLRQLLDSIDDLIGIGESFSRRSSRFSMDALLEIQSVYPVAAKLLSTFLTAYRERSDLSDVHRLARELDVTLEAAYRRFLELVRREEEGTDLADFLSIHQRLRTKVVAFADYVAETRA